MACPETGAIWNYAISDFGYCLINFSLCGNIYTTVIVSIERYFGTSHSFSKCTRKTWIYLVPLFLIVFCTSLPQFIEVDYWVENGTLQSASKEWKDNTYMNRYYMWSRIFLEDVIPVPLIIVTNAAIIRNIWRKQATINRTSLMKGIKIKSVMEQNKTNERYKKEVTKTLFMVVGAFLTARLFCIPAKTLFYLESDEEEFIVKWYWFNPIKDLVVTINSSFNFVIYCFVGSRFRGEQRTI